MLTLSSIRAGYRADAIVVDNVTVEVERGDIVGVVGRNGAGKTCLARAAMGLNPMVSGEVVVGGRTVRGRSARTRTAAGLALVPEGRMIFSQLTVRENLVAAAYGVGRTLDTATLGDVRVRFPGLESKLEDRAGSLSGGEQQWVAIARALVQKPIAVILDEPSLGLSPVAVRSLAEHLGAIRDAGIAILLMEQNPHLLRTLCSQVHVLDRGRVVRTHDQAALAAGESFAEVLLGA